MSLAIWCRIQLVPYLALVEFGAKRLVTSTNNSYSPRNLYVVMLNVSIKNTIVVVCKLGENRTPSKR